MRSNHFQTISASEQHLFAPACPVWAARWRLSRDLDRGVCLLQVRLVNLDRRALRRVYLRVVCLAASGAALETVQLLPLEERRVLTGEVFGDDQVLELPVPGAETVRVYVQRAVFADGTSWNETADTHYLAYPAPVRVRPEDPAYPRLREAAREGRVRNEVYFHAQQGLWVCTCGLPNAGERLRCVHCGADRLWLETHMNPAEPAPEPEPEPEPAPEPLPPPPAPVIRPTPVVHAPPVEEFHLEELLRPTPARRAEPAPAPAPREKDTSSRAAVIALAAVAVLLVGAFAAFRFLTPWLRYREALELQARGEYEQAALAFEALGDYQDSAKRVLEATAQRGLNLMTEGRWTEAYEIFLDLEGYEDKAADCLYSMIVTAINDNDLDGAEKWIHTLESTYRDPRAAELRAACKYAWGVRTLATMDEFMSELQRIDAYSQAQLYFEQAGGLRDAPERALDCRYRANLERMALGLDDETVIQEFAALGDYGESRALMLDLMYAYAAAHLDGTEAEQARALEYLDELVAADYEGAQLLRDRYLGKGYVFQVLADGKEIGKRYEAEDLTALELNYTIYARSGEHAVRVLLKYKLPDGREGRAFLNSDGSAEGSRSLESLLPASPTKDGIVSLRFYDAERTQSEPVGTVEFVYVHKDPPPEDSEKEETAPKAGR